MKQMNINVQTEVVPFPQSRAQVGYLFSTRQHPTHSRSSSPEVLDCTYATSVEN